MVKTEFYKHIKLKKFYRTYSDAGYYIIQEQTGIKYEEAIDIEGAGYTYVESDELIPLNDEMVGDE